MILGLGSDIVECIRIREIADRHGKHFLDRFLTPKEQEESHGQLSYYSGRWAAKEAVSKALGCGLGAMCSPTDIEILHDEKGRPEVSLSGAAKKTFEDTGADKIHVTITHERQYAAATAIIEKL